MAFDRLPALPLIANDPYFSVWLPADLPTDANTIHWAGAQKWIRGHMTVDGKRMPFRFGKIVPVRKDFMVHHKDGYRVNAIGATCEVNGTEADVIITQKDFMPRFSVDKKALLYRLEVYKDDAFCGMILVDFGTAYHPENSNIPLTAVKGEESELGY